MISTHIKKLLLLNTILDISDVKALRTLYSIKTQILSLYPSDQDCADDGLIIIPVLLTKLPSELSRKCGKDIWDIWEEVSDLINLEIEVREISCGA